MKSSVTDRAMDVLTAGSLAIFPLLPAGPTYLGLEWPWALEAFFVTMMACGLLLATAHRWTTAPARGEWPRDRAVRFVRRGYATWLIPAGAAMIVGLLRRMPLDSVFIAIDADGLAGRLMRPMDQAADPFYPLRVGLTYLEGALAFWALSAVLARSAPSSRRMRLAIHACLIAIALVSVVALIQYVTRANLLEYWVRANPGLTRAHATLDDPNSLASFLVLGIGLAIGVAWSGLAGTDGRLHRGAALTTMLGCAALVTTVSRSGWAAFVIALIVSAAVVPEVAFDSRSVVRRIRRGARLLLGLAIAALAVWSVALAVTPKRTTETIPETPWQAVVQTVDPRESLEAVLKGRLLVWRAAVDLASTNWTAGAGLGEFPRFYATYPHSAGAENAHNYFLQVLAEGGLVGLAALGVLLLTIALATAASRVDRGRRDSRFAFGLGIGLLAFVLTWITGHPLLTVSNQLWLASVLAVGLAALRPEDAEPRESHPA